MRNAFLLLVLLCDCWNTLSAQTCSGGGPASIVTLNLSGLPSMDFYNDPDNTTGNLFASITGDVVGVQVTNVNLNTTSSSWCSDASIDLLNMEGGLEGVTFSPSADNSTSPCNDLPLTQFFNLVTLGLEFPTGPGGKIHYQLWEFFDDLSNTADATYSSGMIDLYVCPAGQFLPLELLSFKGRVEQRKNIIEWTTASERGVREYSIERSPNGTSSWIAIGSKPSAGDSQEKAFYALEDNTPLPLGYYRLRSMDTDGKENLSKIIRLDRKGGAFQALALFPVPTTAQLTIQFEAAAENPVEAVATDVSGRVVLRQIFETHKGLNTCLLDTASLPPGSYFLRLDTGSDVTEPMRFVKS